MAGNKDGGVTGNDLLATLQLQAEYQAFYDAQPPVACPRDGEPMREGPPESPGILYCRFCGFLYPDDWDATTMSGM